MISMKGRRGSRRGIWRWLAQMMVTTVSSSVVDLAGIEGGREGVLLVLLVLVC
jgi:hypothetical protein